MADARKDEKTNIQVGIRVRPCIKRELESHKKIVMKTNENRIFSTANDKPAISYQFDKVFGEAISTEQIYETLGSPIVEYVVAGFHGTLLAYGQTASGKTHTIMGDPGDEGIIPRALKDLFHNIHKCENREFLIRASYLEIYNEVITDLLKTGNQPEAKVQIRTDESGVVYVDNLTEFNITNFEEGLQLVKQGQENRSIGKTLMNERSSRSHVIFRLVIESREWQDPNSTDIDLRPVYSAELNLVDLAGSERVQLTGAQGQRFKESTYINQSLLTLGTVIARLCEKTRPDHVPYRDSKLTRLLQNSLGGNARTAMICCVSPVVYEETVQTLKFAARAKNVQNKPTVNEVFEGNSQMKKQMMEIRDLKNKIKELEDVQHGDLLMEQEIIAEKQMFRKKIEAQEERIQELLRQVVHGRNTVIQESTTEKYKRRQTWCPGSLQKAFQGNRLITIHESDNDSPMVSKKKKLANFRNKTLSPVVSKDRLSDVFVKSDAMECSFERNEYNLLKEEFEEYKATTVKDLSQAEEWLREKEMEAEKLKNQLRDRNVECERLRDTCKTDETSNSQKAAEIEALHQELRLKEEKIMSLKDQTENEEWQTVLSNFLEQEKEKNQTLSQQLESLRLEFANLSKTNEQVMTEKSDLQERLIVVENDLNDYKTQQSTQEQQQTSTQQWEQKISALEEELDLNRELIQTLRTDKNQLEYEKQELLAAQMEQAVSEQSKNLADQALSNVQIAELQENNQQLITKNEKLEKDASAALEQVAQITENVKDHDSKLESLLAEIEQHKEDKACLQIELDRISKDRDALAMDQQVMDYERQNGELEKLRKDHINLQSGFNSMKQEFITADFEKTGDVERIEVELLECKRKLQSKEELLSKEKENADSVSHKLQELEKNTETKQSQWQEMVEKLEAELNYLKAEKNVIGTSNGEQHEFVAEVQLKLDEQSILLQQKIEIIANLLEKSSTLEENNLHLQTAKEEKESQLEELSKTNQNLQSEIKELKENASHIETGSHTNDEVIELRQKLTEQEELLRQKIELVTNLENDHQNFQNVFVAEKEKVTQLEERNFVLQTDKEDKENQLEELSKTNQNLQSEIKELKETMSQIENNTLTTASVIELREKISEQETLLAEKSSQIELMVEEQEQFQKIFTEEKEKSSLLEERNFILQSEKEAKEEEVESTSQTIEHLRQELKESKENIVKLETEIQAKSEEIDSKHTEAETASKEENKSLKAHNDNLIVELNTLQRDLDVLQYEKEQLTSTLQQVEAQAKKTENEVVVGLNDKIQTLEQSLKDKEALVEQVEQSRVADKRGLETRVKELNAVVQQYDQLSQFNNQLRTKISDLEENLFSLQESLESNKETMEESKTTIENLEQTKGSLLSQVEAMKSDLLTKEDAVTSLVHTKETMTQMIQDLETQKEELVGDKDALQEEVEKERKQIESLDSKIQELDQALLKEKESCEEERSLCKSAYERKASEKEAQATELVRCMKRLQSDNVQLNETIEKLRQELDEKTRLNQVEQLSHEKVDELERKCEQLKNLYEEEVKELKDELLNMEKGLTEKENTMTTVSNENEAVKKELGDLQQKYEQSLTSNRNTSPLNNDSAETPKDDLKVLQNKLKLRLEDIEVYKNRIHEQDDEIKKLKSKKEELKDQMKRAITHFESVRRPSGNSSTEEWERLVTDLDKRVLRLNNSNTEITEKNRILKQKLESYSECLKSSQVKLQQQERLLKGSNELNKVQEELNKKANENERLKTGIQKAYSRMTKAETKEKETSSKMDRVTNGLNTAFERYKHYKGRCQTLDGEIKTLKQDLDEARSRLSPRSTTVEPHDTSSRALRSSSRTNQIASSSPQSTNPFLPPTKSTNQTSSSFASSKKISTSTGSLSDFHSMINKDTSKDSATTASDRLPSLSGFTDKAPGNLSDIIGNLQDDEEEDRSLFSLTSPVAKETRKETPEQPFASSILPTNKRKSPIFSTRSAFAVVDSTKENETQERKQAITSPEEVAKKRKSLETAESSQPRRRRISNFDTTPKKAGESECNQQ
uniref:Kinesin motor domain-containing protein n=1 Tax=Clytia hemisphaerica TaxID=252671 RepID=A0A7M5XG34_9CNID